MKDTLYKIHCFVACCLYLFGVGYGIGNNIYLNCWAGLIGVVALGAMAVPYFVKCVKNLIG